jgi:hypothetical protein
MSLTARVVLSLSLAGVGACAASQKAAAKDPMSCERDPNCSKGRSSYIDCTKQCVDDPACTDLCREMQIDGNGRP